MNIAELDDFVSEVGLPVRSETLAEAWDVTADSERSFLPGGQVLVMVTMRASPGMDERLGESARAFVESSIGNAGTVSSTLHRSNIEPGTWFLVERFDSGTAFGRHMGSDYFLRFQEAQESLLAEPVRATFLARA